MPEANVFHLDGQNLHIDYATTSVTGQPIFNYHDAQRTLTFTADQIQAVETDAGTLVSVTIRKTVDAGSTSFSVLIPRTNIESGLRAAVRTIGVTALHRFSLVPFLDRGQLDTYTTTPMHGDAEVVSP